MVWRRQRSRAGLTRRQFLAGSAAGLAALGLGLGTASRRAGAQQQAEILVVGGGVGGVAAALAAARLGKTVILTEETDWIGGQLTAQAVPPDENPWIETTGCTASYRQFRNAVRAHYRTKYALRKAPYANQLLNPGMGTVSALCHEPLVALSVLSAMLQPHIASGKLTILLRHKPVSVDFTNNLAEAVTFTTTPPGDPVVITADYILDATELGDLLPMAGMDFVTGAESIAQTGELHALPVADPLAQQAISWCFPLEYIPGGDFTIDEPENYSFWRNYTPPSGYQWPGRLLSWTDTHPETLQPRTRNLFDGPPSRDWGEDMWHFRRIFWHDQCLFGLYPSDITLVNWPQIDYWLKPLVRPDLATPALEEAAKQEALDEAKELSLSMLYWMQTEAPRFGGGTGYPELRLVHEAVDTEDGLAKVAYVRESRRIKAKFTVLEQHIGVEARPGQTSAAVFPDSVGIGYYRIDLHPDTSGHTYVDIPNHRFQIPLGALIPQEADMQNLLPAAKNIGTTHITNGCYRLHPVEWTIGEAAGALAAFCLNKNRKPYEVYGNGNPAQTALLAEFQGVLTNPFGFVLSWPNVSGQEYPDGRRYGGGG